MFPLNDLDHIKNLRFKWKKLSEHLFINLIIEVGIPSIA